MDNNLRIAIAGLGTVGVGVVKAFQEHAAGITQKSGRSIEIVSVSARDQSTDRGVDLSGYSWAEDAVSMASDDNVDVVVELIGGSEGIAYDLVHSALSNRKHVVTANKALMAHHGHELAVLAEANNVSLQYEAAVAGGIPIIKMMREGLAANNIEVVEGILNGTCNYILTTMRETGRDFDDVLKEAQDKGYAEANPAFDIEGTDAAHKLALLTAIAFGVKPDIESMPVTGVTNIGAEDIKFASQLGYKIKLLGAARRVNGHIDQSVEPCLVSEKSPLNGVEDVFNAVMVQGDFVGQSMATGRGAGEGPTASSVVADIIDIARGISVSTFGVPAQDLREAQWAAPEEVKGQFYLRVVVVDKKGVLAHVSDVLDQHGVSIGSVIQRGKDPDNEISIVLETHETSRKAMDDVVNALNDGGVAVKMPTLLRVEPH